MGFGLPLLRPAERGEVDLEELGEFEQERGGDAALIVLDQVEVGGRDPERGGQRLLGEAAFGAQPADGAADAGFAGDGVLRCSAPALLRTLHHRAIFGKSDD